MAKAKKTGTAVAQWDAELAAAAEQQGDARTSGSGGSFIGTRGAVFAVGGEEVGQDMNVVVLDYVDENQYYDPEVPYDPEQPAPPICFAFAREEGELAPHEAAPDKQNETCTGCEQNAFGSAGKGRRGKACKNVMRLAVIAEGSLEDGIEEAEVMYLKVSTTNVKNFAKVVEQSKDVNFGKKRPLWAFVTEMHIKPHRDNQIELTFKRGADVNNGEHLAALKNKQEVQKEKTMFPYQAAVAVEEAAPAKPSKFAKKR